MWTDGIKEEETKQGSGYVLSLGFHLANHGFSLMDFAQLAWLWKFTPGASGRAVNAGPRSLARVWARVEAERAAKQVAGDNPYLGLSLAELIAAAKSLGKDDINVQGSDAEVLAMRMRLGCRQIIEAGVKARLLPDDEEALLQALKQATKTTVTVLRGLRDRSKTSERQAELQHLAEASGDAPIDGDWMKGLRRDKTGETVANVHNAMVMLRSPNFAGMLDYDELQAAAILRRPVPEAHRPPPATFKARAIEDVDLTTLQARLQRLWLPSVALNVVYQAVEAVARDNSFHPVRDWLDGLVWDGKPRLDSWLTDYLGAVVDDIQNVDYLKEIGPKFLISMVARIYRPGCKVDYMLILEGGQGSVKSSACRVLAGAEYFSDALRDVTHKDASQHLRGLWLVEIAELEAMGKAETSAMKAFITRVTERYRPPFGRKEVIEPRQCVFVGTTNEGVYLKDSTGNRRSWPVKVRLVDLAALKRDRDQLFAEAVARFHQGEQWWPEPEAEAQYIVPAQRSRMVRDIWHDHIEAWLEGVAPADQYITSGAIAFNISEEIPEKMRGDVRKEVVTVADIALYALRRRTKDMSKLDWLRISGVLAALGWKYSHKSHGRAAYSR